MGSLSDQNDLARFMRSPEGQAHLEAIRKRYVGRRIRAVTWENQVYHTAVKLHLGSGDVFTFPGPDIVEIREEYPEVFDRPCAAEDAGNINQQERSKSWETSQT